MICRLTVQKMMVVLLNCGRNTNMNNSFGNFLSLYNDLIRLRIITCLYICTLRVVKPTWMDNLRLMKK
jgi:hypothetical protein